jgi:hypothetical protein
MAIGAAAGAIIVWSWFLPRNTAGVEGISPFAGRLLLRDMVGVRVPRGACTVCRRRGCLDCQRTVSSRGSTGAARGARGWQYNLIDVPFLDGRYHAATGGLAAPFVVLAALECSSFGAVGGYGSCGALLFPSVGQGSKPVEAVLVVEGFVV